jgi:hypothetical protein
MLSHRPIRVQDDYLSAIDISFHAFFISLCGLQWISDIFFLPFVHLNFSGGVKCSICEVGTYSNASGASSCRSCWYSGNQCGTGDTVANQSCNRCNRLRVRQVQNRSASDSGPAYVCRFGDGPIFPELDCLLLPLPDGIKDNCRFESSLSCRWPAAKDEDDQKLRCTLRGA